MLKFQLKTFLPRLEIPKSTRRQNDAFWLAIHDSVKAKRGVQASEEELSLWDCDGIFTKLWLGSKHLIHFLHDYQQKFYILAPYFLSIGKFDHFLSFRQKVSIVPKINSNLSCSCGELLEFVKNVMPWKYFNLSDLLEPVGKLLDLLFES